MSKRTGSEFRTVLTNWRDGAEKKIQGNINQTRASSLMGGRGPLHQAAEGSVWLLRGSRAVLGLQLGQEHSCILPLHACSSTGLMANVLRRGTRRAKDRMGDKHRDKLQQSSLKKESKRRCVTNLQMHKWLH